MKTLQLVCHPRWMAEELSQNSLYPVRQSYGLDIPKYETQDIWWAPQQVASNLLKSIISHEMSVPTLTAPGPDFLPLLPINLTGRTITTYTVEQVLTNQAPAIPGWWKAAEAKIEELPNKYRTLNELQQTLTHLKIPYETVLHYTPTTLNIRREYRVFIRNREAVTTSVYLLNENNETLIYNDHPEINTEPLTTRVQKWVNENFPNINQPAGYVLDVVETDKNELLILEANPAWCSAWYGCDIDEVVKTIEVSQNNPATQWLWLPDPYHKNKTKTHRVLPLGMSYSNV